MSGAGEGGNGNEGKGEGGGDGFTPITSQEELNRIISERLKRAKPADYDDLKAKAAKLDQLEAANKTEADKAAERLAAAEARIADAEARALRRDIAIEHKLAKEDAALLDSMTDEDAMRALAARLAQESSDRKKNGNRAPNEGKTPPTPAEDRMREFTRNLFGSADDS